MIENERRKRNKLKMKGKLKDNSWKMKRNEKTIKGQLLENEK